jgi:hypothetical protein
LSKYGLCHTKEGFPFRAILSILGIYTPIISDKIPHFLHFLNFKPAKIITSLYLN